MPIKDEGDFEARLEQISRLYRALRIAWGQTNASDAKEVAKWVAASGKILEALDHAVAEIEEHTGSADLRLILDQFRAIRTEREQKERA